MKRTFVILQLIFIVSLAHGQQKKSSLPDLRTCISIVQSDITLYTNNFKDHSKETDVMTIIMAAEKHADSTSSSREQADMLLKKNFRGIRSYFLTVSNKTTISTSFLCTEAPYRFCMYNDTSICLYVAAMKDGDVYSEKNMTEKQIASTVYQDCVLPSLTSISGIKDNDVKYFALSIYFGCKDIKNRTVSEPNMKPYCLTVVIPFSDIRKYNEGYLAAEDLTDNAEIYLSNEKTMYDFHRIRVALE